MAATDGIHLSSGEGLRVELKHADKVHDWRIPQSGQMPFQDIQPPLGRGRQARYLFRPLGGVLG